MERNSRSDQEKREARRRRRKRNQILSYITLLLMIGGLAVGIIYGVGFITQMSRQSLFGGSANNQESNQDDEQNRLDVLLDEEPLIPPVDAPEDGQQDGPEVVMEPTYEEKLDEIVNAAIEVMPLEDKISGLFIVTPEAITGVGLALRAGEGTRDALSQYAVGGIIYFAQNIQDRDQLTEMIDNTLLYTKYPLFIGVDEEGGGVSRVAEKGLGERVASASEIGRTMDTANALQAGATIGSYLSELGFNLNFAPVADLANVDNSIMAERAYGSDAGNVASFAIAMMRGLMEQNVTACLKHFPGIGSSSGDTHRGLVVTDRSAEDFRSDEFTVFKTAIDAGANMIMMGHIAAPSLTNGENIPCSMSSMVVNDILRNELGFDGVIITDALNMKAITEYYDSDEAAIMVLKAGGDMILMPEDFEKAYQGILQAVMDGTISEERITDSLRRIYRIKFADRVER